MVPNERVAATAVYTGARLNGIDFSCRLSRRAEKDMIEAKSGYISLFGSHFFYLPWTSPPSHNAERRCDLVGYKSAILLLQSQVRSLASQ